MSGATLNTWGFVGTWFGVFVTFLLAWRAQSASKRAVAAAKVAQSEIRNKQVILQVGQLDRHFAWVEIALSEPNHDWMIRHLNSWQTSAAELVGLLQVSPKQDAKLVTALTKANAMISIAVDSPSIADGQVPKSALQAMREARLDVSTWQSAMSMMIGNNEDE